jgi:hypothetical protein
VVWKLIDTARYLAGLQGYVTNIDPPRWAGRLGFPSYRGDIANEEGDGREQAEVR